MELRHLRYFVAAAEEEHFHRAAERLGIVQPALSRQIRVLEEELGCSLFERLSHGVRLSPAGRVFLEGARAILEEVDWLAGRAKRAAAGQIGLLRIGFNSVGGRSSVLPEAINAFRRAYPQVELKLEVARSRPLVDALSAGRLDVAIVLDAPEEPGWETLLLGRYDFSLVLQAAHPLAAAPAIRLADLQKEHFVLTSHGTPDRVRDRLLAACLAGGLRPGVAQEAGDDQTILQLIAVGLGMSFQVSPLEGPLPAGVAVRRVEDLSVPMQLQLVWRADNAGGAVANFVQTVRDALDKGRAAAGA